MAAIDNLNTAVVGLTAAVDVAVAVLGAPTPTDEQIQTAADTVTAQGLRLTVATTPAVVVPPTPTTFR